jgi:hypothetical protein
MGDALDVDNRLPANNIPGLGQVNEWPLVVQPIGETTLQDHFALCRHLQIDGHAGDKRRWGQSMRNGQFVDPLFRTHGRCQQDMNGHAEADGYLQVPSRIQGLVPGRIGAAPFDNARGKRPRSGLHQPVETDVTPMLGIAHDRYTRCDVRSAIIP